MVISAG